MKAYKIIEKLTLSENAIAHVISDGSAPKLVNSNFGIDQVELEKVQGTEWINFFTSAEDAFQLGFMRRNGNHQVPPHCHKPGSRNITTTSEFLLVIEGSIEVELYSINFASLECKVVLGKGDMILLLAGGHSVRFLDNSCSLNLSRVHILETLRKYIPNF